MRIGKTTAKAIIECVKTVDYLASDSKMQVTSEKLHEYLRMSFEYVIDAIEAAIMLQFIKKGKTLTLSSYGQKLINSTTNQSRILFRKQMQKLPYINQLIELISEGNIFEDAVRKIIVSCNIQGNEKEILYSLRNLLVFSKIIGPEGVIEKD
ncbi:MAG: hypothetical protein E3J70_03990 [Candidatus Heimdallarchaeota archaeon]|nr:MAG: hypothetical protein E3J70_03990 [Candidatus Heimdallarchaeota archaeon]